MDQTVIDLKDTPSGVTILERYTGRPDEQGVLERYELGLPPFKAGSYWRTEPTSRAWFDGSNRIHHWAFNDVQGLPDGGLFLLLALEDGDYLAVLPLTGRVSAAWLGAEGEQLVLYLGTLGHAPVSGDLPVLAWSRAANTYVAARQAWEAAIATEPIRGSVKLRGEKSLPDFLHYLGFATWEEYRTDYDAAKLVDLIGRLNASGVPVRWIQIGVGHSDGKPLHRDGDGQARQDWHTDKLNSFRPDPAKFPAGWKPVMDALTPGGVSWLGLFEALSGLVTGIHPDNDLGALNEHLMPVSSGALAVRNDPRSAEAFYDAMVGEVRRNGFRFIKMDFESPNLKLYVEPEPIDNPIQAAVNNQRAYQAAAKKHLDGTINCMAMYPTGVFHTADSTMTRFSIDYTKWDMQIGRRILFDTYGNAPWLGHTVWGDYDMFHSSDPIQGRRMAVAHALSGGTIYVSDRADQIARDVVLPLCYRDGRILRPLAPAAPLTDSLFINALSGYQAYRVVAPLPNQVAAVAVYNLSATKMDVDGVIRPEDYAEASNMLQPYPGAWRLPAEGLVLYDWYAKTAERLLSEQRFAMRDYSDRYVLLCPIQDGWALIGCTDKYLSPAAVEVVSRGPGELTLKMIESGPLAVWTEQGAVWSAEATFRDAGGGLWTTDIPVGQEDFVVRLRQR
ncbi:MAG: hypothetical protein HY332_23630 [Chloroflexi bacterium]|nr:hypothetical protein [Chloroflexota bacterium]